MMYRLRLTKLTLFEAFQEFKAKVQDGEDNFDFVLDEDFQTLGDKDIVRYKSFLNLVADIIIEKSKAGQHIAVDVLTDLLTLSEGPLPDESGNYVLCANCPMYHCKQAFDDATGCKFIPPKQYCLKAFAERDVTARIITELKLCAAVSDFTYDDMLWIGIQLSAPTLMKYKATALDTRKAQGEDRSYVKGYYL